MKINFYSSLILPILSLPLISTNILANTQIEDLQNTQGITISGQIESVVGNDFILNDGTGEVIVDAGPIWWHQLELNTGESITVVGEMDEGEFDAFSITRENGKVIEIRDPQGPPPWSGDRQREI
jgi:hypothetical protein